MIGVGPAIPDQAEFLRRARIAINGISSPSDFLKSIKTRLEVGTELTEKQLQVLPSALHDRRHDITDHALREYVATKARGYR